MVSIPIGDIRQQFTDSIGTQIDLEPRGIDRYLVDIPFVFDDGDQPVIVLKREMGQWILTDEGNTIMRLTYRMDEKDLRQGTRQAILTKVLNNLGVKDRDGEILLSIPDQQYGAALFTIAQAILQISDVSFLAREVVRSTFLEDLREFVHSIVAVERIQDDWYDPRHDPNGNYLVDYRINGDVLPQLFIFALPNDDRVRDTTIKLLQFERWGLEFQSIAVFEDQQKISRDVLARFSDVTGKQYSNLDANKERISRDLQRIVAH